MEKNIKKSDIKKYIFDSYPFINKNKLACMVSDFGDKEKSLSAEYVYQQSDNPAFMAGYAQLVNSAMKKAAFKKAFKKGTISFADGGTTTPNGGTTTPKGGATGFEWFSKISEFLLGGWVSFVDFKTGASTAQANAMQAQANATRSIANVEMIKYIMLGLVVIVLVFVGIKLIKH
jgi:hypothetical protein